MNDHIVLVDTTLRDGSHAVAHQFTLESVRMVAASLERSQVRYIEVGHGDGLGGNSIQYGFGKEQEEQILIEARSALDKTQLAVLLLPGIGTYDELARAKEIGATMVRVATHCTEADISEQYMHLAKQFGMQVVGFLMMAHMLEPDKLAEQATLMASYGADVVYVTDSAGALLPNGAAARVKALRAVLDVPVGFHAHNNLGLAIGNSVAAVEAGATYVDGTLGGLGAGAGNAPIEVLAAVLDKMGYSTGLDLYGIMDAADQLASAKIAPLVHIGRSSLLLGYAGVYSSFLLHAERAAKRFGVDARDVLTELGRRKVVGGQEDMIIDVAFGLSEARKAEAH
ncbi:MAG: 4-hydroxy-2-oxovalerate aldolase [Anaerolineae bacterium]